MYICTYMHAIPFDGEKRHELEGEQGGVYESVYMEEKKEGM